MLSRSDSAILKELQDDFPIVSRPYALVARRLNLTESALIGRIRSLRKRKIIRYAGAIFETRRLGIISTLVAAKVPVKNLGRVIKVINSYPQVTHNYLRQGDFNIWFTLSAPGSLQLKKLLEEIKEKAGVSEVLNLETLKVLKINARFKIKNK
jgi:siroheme decarboxylase